MICPTVSFHDIANRCRTSRNLSSMVGPLTTTLIPKLSCESGVTAPRRTIPSAACTPEGRDVFWHQMRPPQRILRLPLEGGPSVKIGDLLDDGMMGNLAISPDGKLLAYPFEEHRPVPKMKLAVIAVDGEAPPKVLDAPGHVYGEVSLSWSGDGKALQYLLIRDGATNLW